MGKSKKEHRAKVAKRNAKIQRERVEFQRKMNKLREMITSQAMLQSNMINQEVEEAIENVKDDVTDVTEQ